MGAPFEVLILSAGLRVNIVHFGDVVRTFSCTLARPQKVPILKRAPPLAISVASPLLTSRVPLASKILQVVRRQAHGIR